MLLHSAPQRSSRAPRHRTAPAHVADRHTPPPLSCWKLSSYLQESIHRTHPLRIGLRRRNQRRVHGGARRRDRAAGRPVVDQLHVRDVFCHHDSNFGHRVIHVFTADVRADRSGGPAGAAGPRARASRGADTGDDRLRARRTGAPSAYPGDRPVPIGAAGRGFPRDRRSAGPPRRHAVTVVSCARHRCHPNAAVRPALPRGLTSGAGQSAERDGFSSSNQLTTT